MRQIILSQEFQLLFPFFIVVVVFLITWIAFLIFKITQAIKNRKFEKELENVIFETGENIMKSLDGKTMFEDAVKGVLPTGGTGNQTRQVKVLMSVMQGLSSQSVGIVQKMRQLTLLQAASAEIKSGDEIIHAVDQHISGAESQFNSEAPAFVASALGNEAVEPSGIGVEVTNQAANASPVNETPSATEGTSTAEVKSSTTLDEKNLTVPMNETIAKSIIRSQALLKTVLRTHMEGSLLLSDFELKNLLLDELIKVLLKEDEAGTLYKIERGEELLAFLQGLQKSLK